MRIYLFFCFICTTKLMYLIRLSTAACALRAFENQINFFATKMKQKWHKIWFIIILKKNDKPVPNVNRIEFAPFSLRFILIYSCLHNLTQYLIESSVSNSSFFLTCSRAAFFASPLLMLIMQHAVKNCNMKARRGLAESENVYGVSVVKLLPPPQAFCCVMSCV